VHSPSNEVALFVDLQVLDPAITFGFGRVLDLRLLRPPNFLDSLLINRNCMDTSFGIANHHKSAARRPVDAEDFFLELERNGNLLVLVEIPNSNSLVSSARGHELVFGMASDTPQLSIL
jgi:hypothetical protein